MKKLKVFTKAFTLSEMLITLMIIGVVAALTIPTIREHSDETSFVAATKKAYSTIAAATTALESTYMQQTFWPWNDTETIRKRYAEVLNGTTGFPESYNAYTLDNTHWATISGSWGIKTTDGMIFMPSNWTDGKLHHLMYVNVNGAEKPNIVGIDVHAFSLDEEGVFPLGANDHYGNQWWSCTNYVIVVGRIPWINDRSYKNCYDARIKGKM